MRAYLIDEMTPSDMEKISGFLKENAIKSNLHQIFWVQIPDNLLSNIRFEQRHCRPRVFSVVLGWTGLNWNSLFAA
jgi:hypothetical protein